MNNASKILLAFAAGAAAGAIAGILLAPDKGSETRRKMGERGQKFADDLRHRFEEAKAKFECLQKEMEEANGQKA